MSNFTVLPADLADHSGGGNLAGDDELLVASGLINTKVNKLRTDFANASGIWVKDGFNLGVVGSGIFTAKDSSKRLPFKRLIPGFNIGITGDANSLTIAFTGNSDIYAVKSADETINNVAALQDDDHLFANLVVNATYAFEIQLLMISAAANSDFQFGFALPAGATMFWGPHGGTKNYFDPVGTGANPEPLLTLSDVLAIGNGPNENDGLFIRGVVFVGITAGQLKLRWAQNTAKTTNSTVKKGSFLKTRRIV